MKRHSGQQKGTAAGSGQTLSVRQATLWLIMYELSSAFLLLPGVLTKAARQDAWMSVLVALVWYLLLVPVYAAAFRRQGGHTFVGRAVQLFGGWGGKLFSAVFLLAFPYLIFVFTLRDLSEFIATSVFPETPALAIAGGMLIAVIYAVRSGLPAIGRTAEVLFFLVLFLFGLGYLSLFPTARPANLLPMLEFGPLPVVKGALVLFAFPYMETTIFLFLAPYLRERRKWPSILIRCSLASGGMFFLMTLLSVAVLGERMVANLVYPSYFVVETISYPDLYERFEVIVAILWYITLFFRMALLLFITAEGLGEVFRLSGGKPLVLPLSLLGLVLSLRIWPNTTALISGFGAWSLYAVLFGVPVPVLLLLAGRLRGKSGNG